MTKAQDVISDLKKNSKKQYKKQAERVGIKTDNLLGVSKPRLEKIAKLLGKDQRLALLLWKTGIYEARTVAAMIADPDKMTEKQIESWVKDIDSWAMADHVAGVLFNKTKFSRKKVHEWTKSQKEFVKRSGYVMIAMIAVHDKDAKDEEFEKYLEIIKEGARDKRNFVKKSVNWSLRQIGKRNKYLNRKAIKTAEEILKDEKADKWIARDALRELKSKEVQRRLNKTRTK